MGIWEIAFLTDGARWGAGSCRHWTRQVFGSHMLLFCAEVECGDGDSGFKMAVLLLGIVQSKYVLYYRRCIDEDQVTKV